MLNDVNFTEGGPPSRKATDGQAGEIRMTVDHGGSRVSYPVPEEMALKLLRQLGAIFARPNRDEGVPAPSEAASHVVEGTAPLKLRSAEQAVCPICGHTTKVEIGAKTYKCAKCLRSFELEPDAPL